MFQTCETFGTQIKIFWMKSESCQTLPQTARVMKLPSPERYQKYCQIIPCDFSGSTVILWSYENTFVRKNVITTLFDNFFSSKSVQDMRSRGHYDAMRVTLLAYTRMGIVYPDAPASCLQAEKDA